MAYADLTTEQKETVDALDMALRQQLVTLVPTLEAMQAIVAYYTGNAETVLAELQSSDVVPTKCTYAGCQDLTKEQLVNLCGYLIVASATGDGASGSLNTNYHRALYARAIGPERMSG